MTSSPPHRPAIPWLDLGLLVAALSLGWIWLQPGLFSVDESHYLLAADALAARGSFQIDNGYRAAADPALLFFYTVVPDLATAGATPGTVPPYHAVLAWPWLRLLGVSGLFVLNLLAFGLTLVAVRRLAARLHPGRWFPLLAALVFGGAIFGLEYAVGLWPHALSQALVAWSLLAVLAAAESPAPGSRRILLALGAGLLLGVAAGVRLQNALLLPALLVAGAWALRLGPGALMALGAGALAPLLGLAVINAARLQSWNPFTYGAAHVFGAGGSGRVLGLLLAQPWLGPAALGAIAGAWVWSRHTARPWLPWLLLGGLGLGGTLALPVGRELLGRWLGTAAYHLVDSSLYPAAVSVGARFNDLGQVLYGGVMKKSLLEAAPFLALAPLALGSASRPARFLIAFALGGLALLPLVLSAGGWCYNPRYLLELTPALALAALAAAGERPLARPALLAGATAGLLLALPLVLHPGRVDQPAGGWWPALVPLALAVLAPAAWCLAGRRRWAAPALAALLAAGVTYGAACQLGVDLSTATRVRHLTARMAEEGAAVLPSDQPALLLVERGRTDAFSPLKVGRDLWLAGLDPAAAGRPPAFSAALGRRRVFALANGLDLERLASWAADCCRTETTERAGLVFVEFRPRESTP